MLSNPSRGCRIGKIRLKSGGSLHLLPKPESIDRRLVLSKAREWLTHMVNDVDDVVGFVTVAWGTDFTHTIHDHFGDRSPVDRCLGPDYVAEAMRRRNARVDCLD